MNTKNTKEIFKKNLNNLLNEYNKTQIELANYLGVSNTTINNYVKGYNTPRMDKIDKIAEFFDVDRSTLISANNNSKELELTQEEQKILEPYNKLSTAGKEKAVSYTQDLVDSGKYNKLTKESQDTYITDIDDMRSYLMNIPIAAFDGKLNPAQMDDEEIQSLYKLLKDNE